MSPCLDRRSLFLRLSSLSTCLVCLISPLFLFTRTKILLNPIPLPAERVAAEVAVSSMSPRAPPPSVSTSFEELMGERRARVFEECARNKMRHPIVFGEFYHQVQHHLVWCPVYKASSSNWLTNFIRLSPMSEVKKTALSRQRGGRVNEIASLIYPELKPAAINITLADESKERKFLIVRHPFYRLVSAYRDKMERIMAPRLQSDWYYKLYGKKIIEKYRARALKRFGKEWFSKENNFGTPLAVNVEGKKGGGKRLEGLPTFWEFVQFTIDTPVKKLDMHWRPNSNFCAVCSIKYNYILKFENLATEEAEFKAAMGLTDLLPLVALNRHRPDKLTDAELTQLYFKQLTGEEVKLLYEVYEQDFRSFGYEFEFDGVKYPVPL